MLGFGFPPFGFDLTAGEPLRLGEPGCASGAGSSGSTAAAGAGASLRPGNARLLRDVAHNLRTGRMVTIAVIGGSVVYGTGYKMALAVTVALLLVVINDDSES